VRRPQRRRPPSERGELLPFRDRIPSRSYDVEVAPDTGGFLRPDWRPQAPDRDPREPHTGESWSAGDDHGWSNCTMSSAALAYALDAGKASGGPWGGDFRHAQDDLSGGTDLYDAQVAWQRYGGRTLTIRNGTGWDDVERAHAELRPIVIQGEGNVPGSEAFDGGHACAISPEPNSSGNWLFGDPLANGWQWVAPSAIRTWAQALSSGIYYAVGSPMGGGDTVAGLQLTHPESWAGTVTMRIAGASAIRLADRELIGLGVGTTKRAAMRAQLDDAFGAFPAGSLVYVIGDDLAAVLAEQVDAVADPAGDVEAALAARDAEWIDELSASWPVGAVPERIPEDG
jgi:hypothetical protein